MNEIMVRYSLHPQDEIVEAVQREVDAALMASNRSRTYYSNQLKVVPITSGNFK